MSKESLRKKMLLRNSELSDVQRAESDTAIFENFTALEEYKNSNRVFAYVGVGAEVSTDAIIEKMFSDGKEVYVPLCHGKGVMDAVLINSKSDLKPGRYGIPEPHAGSTRIVPEEIELIIVPGVAFGEDGTRLGRGGGYYDRFLKCAVNANKIALCREINMEKSVPCEAHDECVGVIVTDKRIIKIRSGEK